MENRKLESFSGIVANFAIVLVAIACLVLIVQRINAPKPLQRADVNLLVGKQFPLKLDWESHRKTVVLALQVGCHFCSESAPFYQTLEHSANGKNIAFVAILPQGPEESRPYLQKLGLSVDEVRQSALNQVDVAGTPTLFVVDSNGKILHAWQGKLGSDRQVTVLQAITQS